ncbi:MAG: hypothetical protein KA716_28050 [Gloeotrichia echinulata DEX184]|jgi:hypothetical protein|nr:hypothetical protein [Gloeotrichia echinulata DEX184]
MHLTDIFDSFDQNDINPEHLVQDSPHHDLTSSFSDDRDFALDLNDQDFANHNHSNDSGGSLEHFSQNLDHFSIIDTSHLDSDYGIDWEHGEQSNLSYTDMANSSDSGLELHPGDSSNHTLNLDGSYTQDAIASFSWQSNDSTSDSSHNNVSNPLSDDYVDYQAHPQIRSGNSSEIQQYESMVSYEKGKVDEAQSLINKEQNEIDSDRSKINSLSEKITHDPNSDLANGYKSEVSSLEGDLASHKQRLEQSRSDLSIHQRAQHDAEDKLNEARKHQ